MTLLHGIYFPVIRWINTTVICACFLHYYSVEDIPAFEGLQNKQERDCSLLPLQDNNQLGAYSDNLVFVSHLAPMHTRWARQRPYHSQHGQPRTLFYLLFEYTVFHFWIGSQTALQKLQ